MFKTNKRCGVRLSNTPTALLISLAIVLASLCSPAQSDSVTNLRQDAPTRYIVKSGDTLWAISGVFLDDPSRWPDIWQAQPEIENPHLIYPGDSINLRWDGDMPILLLQREGEDDSLETAEQILIPSLRVGSPAPGEVVFFRDFMTVRVEAEHLKLSQVTVDLLGDGGEKLVEQRTVDLVGADTLKTAELKIRIPEQSGPRSALLVVRSQSDETPLQRSFSLLLERRETFVNVVAEELDELRLNVPFTLSVESSAGVRDIAWTIDGQNIGTTKELNYSFRSYGKHQISAAGVGPDGLPVISPMLQVEVPIRPVAAAIRLREGDNEVDSKVNLNAELSFEAEIEGDWTDYAWRLDGNLLEKGTQTLLIDEFRPYKLSLEVIGTPEAGSIEITREFRPSDRILFFSYLLAVLVVLSLLGWLMLAFNSRRLSRFIVVRSEHDQRPAKSIKTSFGKLKQRDLHVGRWNWLAKRSQIDLTKLVDDAEIDPANFMYTRSGVHIRDRDRVLVKIPMQMSSAENAEAWEILGAPNVWLKIVKVPSTLSLIQKYWIEMVYLLAIFPAGLYVIRQLYNNFF